MEEIMLRERVSSCAACSDFPTAHVPTFISSTIDGWINDALVKVPRFDRAMRHVHRLADALEPTLLRLAYVACGKQVLHDPEKSRTNRTLVLWQEAIRRGIPMEQIAVFGTPSDYYRARINDEWLYFEGLPIPRRGRAPYSWMDDKKHFKRFLQTQGIPCADAFISSSLKRSLAAFEKAEKPVVVKPRLGSRARHTSTYVQDAAEFERAFRSAQQLCRQVLFETHLMGDLCRATVIEGRIAGFLRKVQPRVVGDGVQTVRQLVEAKNRTKPERVSDIRMDAENEEYIRRQGYGWESLVEKGRVLDISRHSGRMVGGETREIPESIHPKLHALIERLAQLLDVPVAGFDLIIPDPETDPDTQKWGILEANTLPFIDLHYNPLYGKTSNVAGAIWDLWQEKGIEKTPA
jgi:cyanophycin synthetase